MKKTKTVTLKGWANKSDLIFSQNSDNSIFNKNLQDFLKTLKGYKKLSTFDTLRGKEYKEKIIIRGWYWRGSWADPTKETVLTLYK